MPTSLFSCSLFAAYCSRGAGGVQRRQKAAVTALVTRLPSLTQAKGWLARYFGCLVRTRMRRLAMPSGLHRIAGTLVIIGEGSLRGDIAWISCQSTLEPTHSSGLLAVPHQDLPGLAGK